VRIEHRALAGPLEVRDDGEGRTLTGTVVPYGQPAKLRAYTETFERGAFADAVTRPEAVKLLAHHDAERLPIGRALDLTETADALVGEFRVSRTAHATTSSSSSATRRSAASQSGSCRSPTGGPPTAPVSPAFAPTSSKSR
jgi:phage head maturation protease